MWTSSLLSLLKAPASLPSLVSLSSSFSFLSSPFLSFLPRSLVRYLSLALGLFCRFKIQIGWCKRGKKQQGDVERDNIGRDFLSPFFFFLLLCVTLSSRSVAPLSKRSEVGNNAQKLSLVAELVESEGRGGKGRKKSARRSCLCVPSTFFSLSSFSERSSAPAAAAAGAPLCHFWASRVGVWC